MSLYKYMSAEIAEIVLRNREIRFTQPIAFNDPYDVYPKLSKVISDNQLKLLFDSMLSDDKLINDMLDEVITKEYAKLPQNLKLFFSHLPIKKILNNYIEQKYNSLFNLVMSQKTNIREQMITTLLYLISNHIGILSMSKIYDNLLMWSHYSNCHKGIVLEFDENHPFLCQFEQSNFSENIEVEYTSERPELYIESFDITPEESMEVSKKILFTKSTEWSYEEEYRIIRFLNNIKKLSYSDSNGYDIYVKEFPKELITGIILGSKIDSDYKTKLYDIIEENSYNINIKQASLSPENYKIILKAT